MSVLLKEIDKRQQDYLIDNKNIDFLRTDRIYGIYKNNDLIGYAAYGGSPNNSESCEIGVYVYPQFRKNIMKKDILSVINFPKFLGYKNAIIPAHYKSVNNVLSLMRKYGIYFCKKDDANTYWFKKEF